MKMHLYHGRTDPAADMDGWGVNGPTLTSIVHLQWTYNNIYLLFATSEDCEVARRQTGWPSGPFEYSLEVPRDEDMVTCTLDGKTIWFGDWCLRPEETL